MHMLHVSKAHQKKIKNTVSKVARGAAVGAVGYSTLLGLHYDAKMTRDHVIPGAKSFVKNPGGALRTAAGHVKNFAKPAAKVAENVGEHLG